MFTVFVGVCGVVVGAVAMWLIAKNNREKFAASLEEDAPGIFEMLKAEAGEIDISELKNKIVEFIEKAKAGK